MNAATIETGSATDVARARRNEMQRARRAKAKATKAEATGAVEKALATPNVANTPVEVKRPANVRGLGTRAMLVHLSIGFWEGRKKDKAKTDEVTKDEGATGDAGAWWTKTIPTGALRPVLIARSNARVIHLKYTLPWHDEGTRILPAEMFMKYTAELRAARDEFQKAVDAFVAEYPNHIRDAQQHLGGLFKEGNYPSTKEVASRFPWSMHIVPLPDANDFRVQLGDEAVASIQRDIAAQTEAAVADAMGNLWVQLYEQVKKIAEKLTDAKGIFRDSLIGNLAELCGMLPSMNVTGDPELEAMRQTVLKQLAGQDPEVLRKNTAARGTTAKAANDIMKAMEAWLPKTAA